MFIDNYLIEVYLNVITAVSKPKSPAGRKKKLSDRYVLDRIIKVLRTGMQWCELDVINGSSKTVYNRFRIWVNKNVFEKHSGIF